MKNHGSLLGGRYSRDAALKPERVYSCLAEGRVDPWREEPRRAALLFASPGPCRSPLAPRSCRTRRLHSCQRTEHYSLGSLIAASVADRAQTNPGRKRSRRHTRRDHEPRRAEVGTGTGGRGRRSSDGARFANSPKSPLISMRAYRPGCQSN